MMNKEKSIQKFSPDEHSNEEMLIDAIENLRRKNEILAQEKLELSHKLSQAEMLLETARHRVSWFEEQIQLARQQRFGKSSEKSSVAQLDLFNAIDDVSAIESAEEEPALTEKSRTLAPRNRSLAAILIRHYCREPKKSTI
jgi:hypothetical protein